MKRLLVSAGAALAGYLIGAVAGGYLVATLTSNSHDSSVEGAMTGAFVIGPIAALVSAVVAFVRTRRS